MILAIRKHIFSLGFLIWLIAAIFFLYEFFLRTFVGSVAQQIIPSLHLTATKFAMVGAAYYLAYLMQSLFLFIQ